jgi:hypothetical protein
MPRKAIARSVWYVVVSPAALMLGCYPLSIGWLAARHRGTTASVPGSFAYSPAAAAEFFCPNA